jgi:hypothetical protein
MAEKKDGNWEIARLFLLQVADLPGHVMSLISPVASSRCKCGRATSHAHYSGNHDFFVKSGLVLLLLSEAVSFVQGWVKGSTTLYLSNAVIEEYETVMRKMAELTAPYEYLSWLAIVLELITLILAVLAVASLHSIKDKNTHGAAIVGTVATFIIGMITKRFYISATDAALTRLPSVVDADLLATARQVQEDFQRRYGFWGTPAPDAVNILCSLAGLGLFMGALITTQHFTFWQPSSADVSRPSPPAPEPARPVAEQPIAEPTFPTKFCRYCGARIFRDSKFCEECGGRLT